MTPMNRPNFPTVAGRGSGEEPLAEQMATALQAHVGVCNELLALAQAEAEALKSPARFPRRRFKRKEKPCLRGLIRL